MPVTLALAKTFPANTLVNAPLRDTRTVQRGWYLKEVRMHVPSGHSSLVPVWFEQSLSRVVPTDQQEIRLDGVPDLPIPVGTFVDRDGDFALVGYNEDTVNVHTTRALAIFLLPGDEGYPTALAHGMGVA